MDLQDFMVCFVRDLSQICRSFSPVREFFSFFACLVFFFLVFAFQVRDQLYVKE